jgi:hypothetical protein
MIFQFYFIFVMIFQFYFIPKYPKDQEIIDANICGTIVESFKFFFLVNYFYQLSIFLSIII